ncbi:ABC transporter substrate-binding protein [Microcella indica]|uniref:ABC transporter substrate-binding protein n=1 Tax=Microcella indica TaxID=2750620 RepID=UPI0015CF76C2|nr:ABC transporter substrate-binding protein [Microcella indica]
MRTQSMIATGASLAMIAALAGCAGSETTPAGATSIEFDPENPVTIQFWNTMNDPAQTRLGEMVDDFEESHPGILVDPIYQPYDAILPSIQTAIAAGDPPALSQMEVSTMAQLAGLGVLEPLDSLSPDLAAGIAGDMEDSIVSVNSYDGTQYTVPFGYSTNVLYYNVDLLSAAGYDADSMPTTWDGLQEAALAVRETAGPDVLGFGFGAAAPWAFEMRLFQLGGQMFDDDGTTAEFNSPEGVRVLENYQDLLASGASEMIQTDATFSQLRDLFTTGRVAMWEQSSAGLQAMTEAAGFEVGVATYTTMGDDVSLLGGQNLGVFADISEEEKAAAATFIEWWTSPEVSAEWSVASGYIPGMKSAWETETLETWLAEDPRRGVAASQIPGMRARPNLPGYPEIATVIADAFQAALTGQGDPASILDDAAARADEILARN